MNLRNYVIIERLIKLAFQYRETIQITENRKVVYREED